MLTIKHAQIFSAITQISVLKLTESISVELDPAERLKLLPWQRANQTQQCNIFCIRGAKIA